MNTNLAGPTQHFSKNTGMISREIFNSYDTNTKLTYFCLLAHLAPSSHNTQPWRFFIDSTANTIMIYLDRKFILPASDVAGRQATISIGCAVENIDIGAQYYGYKTQINFTCTDKTAVKPNSERSNELVEILKIKFTESQPNLNFESKVQAIFNRKIVRAEYDPTKAIPDSILQSIQGLADEDTTELHTITDSIRRLTIAEFQAQADAYVINSPKFSRELGDWLLPNNDAGYLGMTGITFGLQDDEALRLHNGLSGKSSLQPEDGLKFATGGKIFIEKSPFIGIITTKKDDVENWVMAGRVFEKIFLELTNHGVQVAVHAGITEVPLIKKIFGITIGTIRHITVLFRAGYAKKQEDTQRPFSSRLPLEKVILNDTP